MILAAVAVSVTGDHHDWLELAEAVGRGTSGIVLAAAGPDGANAGRRQERDCGSIRQVSDDAIALFDAEVTQGMGQGGYRPLQVARGEASSVGAARLGTVDQCDSVVVVMPEDLLDVIQSRPGEPLSTRHALRAENRRRFRVRHDLEPGPHRAPELPWVPDRPGVQVRVVAQVVTDDVRDPLPEPFDVRTRDDLRRRSPDRAIITGVDRRHDAAPASARTGVFEYRFNSRFASTVRCTSSGPSAKGSRS